MWPGSNPGIDAICGLTLLLVLSIAERGFSLGTRVSPNLQQLTNSNLIRNQVDEEPLCGCTTCFIISCLYIYYFDITVLVKT